MPDARETRPHAVVVNDEKQYSVWPVGRDLPVGWHVDGFTGTEEECLAYIDQVLDRHAAGIAATVDGRQRAGRCGLTERDRR